MLVGRLLRHDLSVEDSKWPDDAVGARLTSLADRLETELAGVATVHREAADQGRLFVVSIRPVRPDAVEVVWTDMGDLVMWTGKSGHGGRWELGRSLEDVDFIESVVSAVIDGGVTETFGPSRSLVEVRLADGSVLIEEGASAPGGCLPIPGWTKRGRRIQYSPYRG